MAITDRSQLRRRTPQSPRRQLDVVAGRTAAAVQTWQDQRDPTWITAIREVTIDPYAGYKTAVAGPQGQLRYARLIADHFHLARTTRRWEPGLLAWHTTGGLTNARTEAINLLIKKIKRVGHGFRNYRTRLLLHCGVDWHTAPTARIRGRSPRLVASSHLLRAIHDRPHARHQLRHHGDALVRD